MRYMMIVKANPETEAGVMPSPEELAAMGKYNEELVKAGVMLDGNGLRDSSHGFRVQYGPNGASKVIDGPFAEAKELVAGYWIIQVSSPEEAVEWARRIPFQEGEVEIRRVFEDEDFA
ncbi:YciI family protein [Kibdelosporangium philippinense]|uniref:YciI family protein n=1 Tax=Kibdelosporangium philippinense TaxID=211113 RepID=A0ABS8Z6N6_9PSEU|nr:YciI family protein [Kibdelosporangium philippinense]MCE7002728.1 YciI family protein [Kibdelosporangium philippinense]